MGVEEEGSRERRAYLSAKYATTAQSIPPENKTASRASLEFVLGGLQMQKPISVPVPTTSPSYVGEGRTYIFMTRSLTLSSNLSENSLTTASIYSEL